MYASKKVITGIKRFISREYKLLIFLFNFKSSLIQVNLIPFHKPGSYQTIIQGNLKVQSVLKMITNTLKSKTSYTLEGIR